VSVFDSACGAYRLAQRKRLRWIYYNGSAGERTRPSLPHSIPMAQETEIKLRIADPKKFLRSLKKLGARRVFAGTGRVHEWNVIFDTLNKTLMIGGQLLRIRTETPERRNPRKGTANVQRHLLTFKRPSPSTNHPLRDNITRHKVREELELEIADASILTKILEALEMLPVFTYEKFRTTFALPSSQRWAKGLLIELDETPVGTFVELEGPTKAIDRAAKMLGYSEADYVLANYAGLYFEECRRRGEPPSNMVFRTAK
jgi:adenylate cyclase class 2